MVELRDVPGRTPNPIYRAVSIAEGTRSIRIAGQVGDRDGQMVGPGLAEQAEQAARNVAEALEAAGATLADVTALTIYVTDWTPEQLPELRGLIDGAELPPVPMTLVGVQSLFAPGYRIELVVEAVC